MQSGLRTSELEWRKLTNIGLISEAISSLVTCMPASPLQFFIYLSQGPAPIWTITYAVHLHFCLELLL